VILQPGDTFKAGTKYAFDIKVSLASSGYVFPEDKHDVNVTADGTTADKKIKWTINKATNPLTIKAKTATVKYSKLKKKTQTLAVTKVIKFTKKLNDKKTYTLVSAKKGTYKVKVKVKALGNSNYQASGQKTVAFTIKVK